MKDLMEILCWFISIAIRFLEVFGLDANGLKELTSVLMDMGNK